MIDILICSVPMVGLDRPPGAPALLKSAAEIAGFTAKTADFNLRFFHNQCNRDMEKYNKFASAFRNGEVATPEAVIAVEQWIDQCIDYIKKIDPVCIGISVFSYQSHRPVWKLNQKLREAFPNKKIILGGYGLVSNCSSLSNEPKFKKINLIKSYAQYMLENDLADYCVQGDKAIDDFVDILEKEIKPALQHVQTTVSKVIFTSPISNFDDYNLDGYVWHEEKFLPITGSVGCVRACTFCTVPEMFGKFKYRTGEDIGNEIIYLHKKYGIKVFEFTDSLVNGSFKAFRGWLEVLAAYNADKPKDQQIRWFGQYICRPQSQTPSDIYALMAASGVQNLVIGVESGSDEILKDMRKKMSVKDAYDELEQFYRHGIKTQYLMLSGYHTETPELFLKSLEFLIQVRTWAARGVITKLSLSEPLFINDRMHLALEADRLGIMMDPELDFNWTVKDNAENDYAGRAMNRMIAQLLVDKLGLSVSIYSQGVLYSLTTRLEKMEKDLERELEQLMQEHVTV